MAGKGPNGEYTPRGFHWKNCPACHESPEHYYPTDGICPKCTATMKWANAERERQAALKGIILCRAPDRDHEMPYISNQGNSHMSDLVREFQGVMFTLLMQFHHAFGGAGAILAAMEENWHRGGREVPKTPRNQQRSYPLPIAMTPKVADAFDRVFPMVEALMRASYKEGYQKGRSLLGQLATGDISLTDLSEEDVRVAQAAQKALNDRS